MKERRMVHPSHSRAVLTESEAERLRRVGWLELPAPVALNHKASHQRILRERYKAAGLKRVAFYVPIAVADEFAAMRREGENLSDLLIRVVKLLRVL